MGTDKITITLTLTIEDADMLVATLNKGADSWYGSSLISRAKTIAKYVDDRRDAAIFARGRARRRADQRRMLDAESASRTRASAARSNDNE
jgi:hypothetical protein